MLFKIEAAVKLGLNHQSNTHSMFGTATTKKRFCCRSVLVQLAPRLNCFSSFKISRKVLDSIPAGCY
ncbi:hypothetical protein CHARACLAT_017424 [Characodon lateralis]|uniref:Uncharacterized protein n=1 Tax=Characodon lateralis TaxID=208331 RepID=A0ABU7D1G9_9TELE|nr:hypothetical protein [Characodon lateralis]